MLKKVNGFVLRERKNTGAHSILTVYTKESGKMKLMATGLDKPTSKLKSGCSLFVSSSFVIEKRENGIGRIVEAEVVNSYVKTRSNLIKSSYAEYFTEILDNVTELEVQNELYYRLLAATFSLLEESLEFKKTSLYFIVHLIRLLGYFPYTKDCFVCGEESFDEYFLNISDGAIRCKNCRDIYDFKLSKQMLSLLYELLKTAPSDLTKIDYKYTDISKLRVVMEKYLKYHCDIGKINAADFISSLE